MGAVQEIGDPQCQALNLSDAQRCIAQATANDGLFCHFHAKQCFGLYMGYKRRNDELDALAEQEPAFLRNSKLSLVSQTFDGIKTETELEEVHQYLFNQYVLLGKVISARNLHHKHFYSLEMDYGHKAYLDKLVSTRHSVMKALESLEKRTAQVLYQKEKWFNWVREVQDDQDKSREKEQKKIKLEAALFRRHWREMEARLAAAREKEEKRRQEAYLEEVWKERMAEKDMDAASWDPIEDVYEDDRERYIHLIRHFLWIEPEAPAAEEKQEAPVDGAVQAYGGGQDSQEVLAVKEAVSEPAQPTGEPAPTTQAKKKKRGGNKKSKASPAQPADSNGQSSAPPTTLSAAKLKQANKKDQPIREPDQERIESKDEVCKRLKEGIEKDYSHVDGPMIVGTAQNPPELFKRTAPVKDDDIAKLVSEITEIKLLLFCRQLMSHSKLLPAALRAKSVDEFLADPSISDSDLRDLCLQVERPTFQALRDACADFARGDVQDDDKDDEEDSKDEEAEKARTAQDYILHHLRYGSLDRASLLGPGIMNMYRRNMHESNSIVKSLMGTDKEKKMKVTICGRSIWNYASHSSMARNGWLHFSILAKDCTFEEAIALCRNWDEFFELNILAMWQYFPASKWTGWSGNYLTEELTQMGFVPFWMNLQAEANTTYNHLSKVSRKMIRQQQTIQESRNFVCAHMKRNDPVTRRFIQYALMRPGEFFVLVRDGKTGRTIVAPKEGHRWLSRSRKGHSRFSPFTAESLHKSEGWDISMAIDAGFFAIAEIMRKFRFNFNSYYEVYIWDFAPGREAIDMYHHIKELLNKAHRVRGCRDKFKNIKHIIGSLTRETDTKRIRQIRPGETSIYDDLTGPNATFWIRKQDGKMIRTTEDNPAEVGPYVYYNDTDAAEDAILFEEESLKGIPEDMPFVEITNPIQQLEDSPMPITTLNGMARELAPLLKGARKDGKKNIKTLNDLRNAYMYDEEDDSDFDNADEFYLQSENESGFSDKGKELVRKDKARKDESDGESAGSEISNDEDEKEGDNQLGVSGSKKPYAPGAEEFPFQPPPIWIQAHNLIKTTELSPEKKSLVERLNFDNIRMQLSKEQRADLSFMHSQEIMERDRSYIFKDTFHLGDLEPGAQDRYKESMKLVTSLQKYESPNPEQHDWPWFCMEVLDWIKLKIHYDDYNEDPMNPWPHPYVVQDITQAFLTMGLFFPNIKTTSIVQEYMNTPEGQTFKESKIFDPVARSVTHPDTRSRVSCAYRPKKFWEEWNNVYTGDDHFIDAFPWDWNMAIRPIIAKLYRAGIVNPAILDPHPDVVPGFAIANTEPHRPGQLDLFIKYSNVDLFLKGMPPHFIDYKDWPDLLAAARKFTLSKGKTSSPRFALLRLWSAPHYYPLMLMLHNRQKVSFIDPVGRAWEFRFIPKDMPMSEWSVHNATALRLGYLRGQMTAGSADIVDAYVASAMSLKARTWRETKFTAQDRHAYQGGKSPLDEHVVHRGDLVLVMGEDEEDLLRWCTAVTFALQTKPWLREVDLWKSFVNVDLGFLEGLDKAWLD